MNYDQFMAQFPAKTYRQGRILIASGEDPECIFLIESGKVRKYDVTRYGEKAVMNTFTESTLFPLSWALNHTPNHYYFEAMTAVTVRCIPTDQVAAYLKAHPDLVYTLLQQVYAGLENTQRRIAYLMRGSLRGRVLFELLIESRRSGVEQDDGSVTITISEAELAERAGLSRETVSRELAKIFKMSDICERRGRSIVIHSQTKLEELLQKST